jgi:peroxiredoxin
MLNQKYRDRGLVVLGLNNEKDHQGPVAFARKTFTYPIFLDADPVFQSFGVQGFPATFVIDRSGKIASHYPGYGSGMEKQLEMEILNLLVPQTSSR